MAEENNEKSFYPFKIKINEANRNEKIESLKAKYPLAKILEVLSLDTDEDDEIALENKLRQAIDRELLAYENAISNDEHNKAKTYADESGANKDIKEFFETYDDYTKNHQEDYLEYTTIRDEVAAQEIPETEKEAKLNELKDKYADAIDSVHRACESKEKANGYIEDFKTLQGTPKKVVKSLLRFYNQCKKAGKEEDFNKIYDNFISERRGEFAPRYKESNPKDKNQSEEIINEHHFNLDRDGRVCYSIFNLQGTGLDITWLDGSLGLARCQPNLTQQQIDALAKYCYKNEIDVTDTMKLNNLLVTDKKGDEIGKAGDVLQQKITDLRNGNEDNTPSKLDENEFSDLLGEPLRVETDPTNYIDKEKDLTVKSRAIIGAVKNRIQTIGYHDPSLTKVRKVWGSIIISVYKNENDLLKDGEVDKNGIRNHTKEFSVRIRPTNPPKVYFYMEQGKEFKSSHARVVLDAMSACGSRYYVIPGGNEIGGSVLNAFMEASGKNLMIPLCKRSKDAPGIYLESDNVEAMLKVIKDENKQDSNKLLDFQIRLVRELKAQELGRCSENPNYKTNSKLSDKIDSLDRTIKYTKLQNGHMTELNNFINAGLAGVYGQKWDEVDRAAALVALKYITEDIGKGKLLGKGYDPLDKEGKNVENMKKALVFYMTAEKPKIVADIHEQIRSSADEKDSKINNAVKDICSKREKDTLTGYFDGTLKNTLGVEGVKPIINSATEKYKPEKYMEMANGLDEDDSTINRRVRELYTKGKEKELQPPALPNPELREFAKDCKEFFKEVKKQSKDNNAKKMVFDEWRRRRDRGAD